MARLAKRRNFLNLEKDGIERVPVTCTVVGLDLSLSSTGFCLLQGQERTVTTIKTKPKDAEDCIARVELICSMILERIPQEVSLICIEDYFVPRKANQVGAAIGLIELGFIIRHKLKYLGYPFFVVHHGQIKKFATGSGQSPKAIVIREVWKRWGVDADDDNQADATAMAYLAQALWDVVNGGDETRYYKYQSDTIRTVLRDRPRFNVEPLSS